MVQLPLAGMFAPLKLIVLAALVRATAAPLQLVAGASIVPDIATLRLAGSVSVKLDCVSANRLALVSVIVRVETTFSPTLAGENASVTVGATGVTVSAVGQAPALVPAEVGVPVGRVIEPPVLTVRTAVSTAPTESVIVRVSVPAVPVGVTVT